MTAGAAALATVSTGGAAVAVPTIGVSTGRVNARAKKNALSPPVSSADTATSAKVRRCACFAIRRRSSFERMRAPRSSSGGVVLNFTVASSATSSVGDDRRPLDDRADGRAELTGESSGLLELSPGKLSSLIDPPTRDDIDAPAAMRSASRNSRASWKRPVRSRVSALAIA
ncbi:MAG: hypothetical protein QM820_50555 [Minicystis sp.]